ncbi:MAG: undecaprenyl-diphosphate phosphatase [Acidimicrobiales bacterium]
MFRSPTTGDSIGGRVGGRGNSVPRLIAVASLTVAGLLLAGPVLAAVAQETGTGEVDELSIWAAIILGLVEGFTDYLPVSSTGHLLVTTEILGLAQTEEAENALDTYAICIQAGAIVAVFVLYWDRIRQMLDGLLGRSEEGRRVLLGVIVAFIPTAIIGLALVDFVKERLFGVPPIAAAWLIGGIAILALTRSGLMDRGGMELGQLTARHAAIIGVAQAAAMWPGTSRSLVTIVAAVLVGLSLRAAVEFSFLLGLATLSAATIVTAATDGAELVDLYGLATPAVGMGVAFLAAMASIKWMVSWLQERSFDVFGYYRIIIGVLAFGAVAAGWL